MMDAWFFFLLSLLPILFILLMFRSYYGTDKNLPPGTMGWIFLGETIEFLTNINGFMQRRHNKYGELFKTHILGCPTVISTDMEINRFVLLNEVGRGLVPSYPKSLMELLGKGNLLLLPHDLHKRMRGAVMSFLNLDSLKGQLLLETDDFVRRNLSDLDGQMVYMQQKCKDMTFHFWVKKVINLQKESEIEALKKDFYQLIDGLLCIPLDLPCSGYRKSLQARKRILTKLGEVLHQRRKLPLNFHNDLLAEVLNTEMNENVKQKLSDEQILDILIAVIFAGYDTASSTMMMAIKFLHDCPKALQDLRLEHQAIISKKNPKDRLSWEDYKAMQFTLRTIKETFRVANIAPRTMRKTTEDIVIGGYKIPKGWRLLLCLAERESYENLFVFDPWKGRKVMAFGEGMRMCPGKDFAMLEMCIFLHHFVTRYEWEEVESGDRISIFPQIQASKGLHVRLRNRLNEVEMK